MNYQHLLKGSIFKLKRLSLCLLVLFISTTVWGGNVHTVVKKEVKYLTTQGSLIIKKNNGKREHIILPETKIKLWTEGGKMKGYYKRIENNQVVISIAGEEKHVPISEINKIKIKKNAFLEGVGGLLKIIGGVALVYTLPVTFFGIDDLVNGDGIGGIFLLLIGLPVLLLGGLGLYFLGRGIRGRKFNLKKKWHIERPSTSKNNEP